jgi:hypothetical protein
MKTRCLLAKTGSGQNHSIEHLDTSEKLNGGRLFFRRLGRSLMAKSLNASAAALATNLQRELLLRTTTTSGTAFSNHSLVEEGEQPQQCTPAAPACFSDAVGAPPNTTSLHATMLPASGESSDKTINCISR